MTYNRFAIKNLKQYEISFSDVTHNVTVIAVAGPNQQCDFRSDDEGDDVAGPLSAAAGVCVPASSGSGSAFSSV